jgi:RND family efflux transporter MFP subunit
MTTFTTTVSMADRYRMLRSSRPLLALAGSALLLAACGGTDRAPSADDTSTATVVALSPADVGMAVMDSLSPVALVSGPLQPARRVLLKAQVDGTIASLRVDRGSPVREGELLLTIDADGVQQQAAGMDAAIAAARAGVAVAEQRRDGTRALFAKGAVAEVDLRAAEAQYEAAVAEQQMTAARAVSAREAASRLRVVAPMAGVVSDRLVQVGEPVSNGGSLLEVVDASTLELAARIGVDEAGLVAVGQTVTFTLAARPGETFRGRVLRIDPEADAATRQVGVYVGLPNTVHRLIAGQFASGRIELGRARQMVVVPQAALRTDAGRDVVATVVDGQIRVQPVTVLARDDARGIVGLADGFAVGTRVLVMPGVGLPDGTPVRLVGTSAPNDSGRPTAPTGGER